MLRAYLYGLLYIGRVYTRPIAGLTAQLAVRLAASGTARAAGVIDYARVLWAVLIALVVWFKEFFTLYCLAYALI